MLSISSERKFCVFCRYWDGPEVRLTRGRKGFWDVESSAKGKCMYNEFTLDAMRPGCTHFERSYKYDY